ncbi:PilW family protein [Novilysobacter erysipheiresistens]|uniref:PilW family protein n=1 Tax=Novilysobacter erysipheiresistens TaxID=1749332 RepID=A0ABU7YTR1_9GAMM
MARGLSLIELMIALLLGLVVTAAAGGMLLANKRVYASTATLNRIQENTRVSFELMSRDLREAGGNPCGGAIPIISQLESGDNSWWTQYADGLHGYDGDAPGTTTGSGTAQRVAGTDAIDLHMANNGDIRVTDHQNPSAVLNVTTTAGLSDGDILMVCNNSFAMVFQASNISGTGMKIGHNGGSGTGNCSQEFQYERNCTSGASGDKGYCFLVPEDKSVNPNCEKHSRSPATVVQVQSFRWYIGNNARGGTSLYRASLINETGALVPTIADTVEIAEGVSGMNLLYRANGAANFVTATAITAANSWGAVNAVQVGLTVEGAEGALKGGYLDGTDGNALSRQLTHVVALRNKEGVL